MYETMDHGRSYLDDVDQNTLDEIEASIEVNSIEEVIAEFKNAKSEVRKEILVGVALAHCPFEIGSASFKALSDIVLSESNSHLLGDLYRVMLRSGFVYEVLSLVKSAEMEVTRATGVYCLLSHCAHGSDVDGEPRAEVCRVIGEMLESDPSKHVRWRIAETGKSLGDLGRLPERFVGECEGWLAA